jgi:hypothetical protein
MIVHNMDSPDLYPYKQQQMREVLDAFRGKLVEASGRAAGRVRIEARNGVSA